MHAIHRGMGRMHKMISNMFKKGMKVRKENKFGFIHKVMEF